MSFPHANEEMYEGYLPGFQERIRAIKGMPLRMDLDLHLIDLIALMGPWISRLEFTATNMEKLADIGFVGDKKPVVEYNPARDLNPREWGEHDAAAARTCALLHEIMHAVCDAAYAKPPGERAHLRAYNVGIPPALDGKPEEIYKHMQPQMQVIQANWKKVKSLLAEDESVTSMRTFLTRKAQYGEDDPLLHYDTILFDMLLYMSLLDATRKVHETPTFRYLKTLSLEAAARRGSKEIQPVAEAPSIDDFKKK